MSAPTAVRVAFPISQVRTALTALANAVPSRPVVPAFRFVRMEHVNGNAVLSAFDYEVSVRFDMGPSEPFPAVLVPHAELTHIVKAFGPKVSGDLLFDMDQVSVTFDGNTWSLVNPDIHTPELGDMPPLPETPNGDAGSLLIDRDTLSAAVTDTLVSAGKNDMLPMLTGLLLDSDAERTVLVSTDRFRLTVADLTAVPGAPFKALIPAKAIASIVKSLPAGTVSLALSEDKSTLALSVGEVSFTVRLIDADFVRWASLIPTSEQTEVLVDQATLLAAIKVAQVTLDKGSHLRMHFGSSDMHLSATRFESKRLPVQSTHTDSLTVGVNDTYLTDALKMLGKGEVKLQTTTPSRPIMFTSDSKPGVLHLVMPARLPG